MKKIAIEPFGKHLDTISAARLALKNKEYGVLFVVNDQDDDWRMKFILSVEDAESMVESIQKAVLVIKSLEHPVDPMVNNKGAI